MWVASISGLIGVAFGALLAFFFGSDRGHAEWVNEQKRLEYRQHDRPTLRDHVRLD